MQFPESWLREFCDPPISTAELAERLVHRLDGVVADERGVGPRQWLLERGGEHHLGRLRELVEGCLFFGPELVLALRDLAGGEA